MSSEGASSSPGPRCWEHAGHLNHGGPPRAGPSSQGPYRTPSRRRAAGGTGAVPAPSPGTALGLGRAGLEGAGSLPCWTFSGWHGVLGLGRYREPQRWDRTEGAPRTWQELSIVPFKCKWNVFSKNTPVRKTKIRNYLHVESGTTEIPCAPSSFNIYAAVKCILSLLNLWVIPSPPALSPLPGSAAI